MKTLLVLGLMLTTSLFAQVAPHAQGKTVIYVQDLVNKNHSGLQSLIKKAADVDVVLEWEQYETSEWGLCDAYDYDSCMILKPKRIKKNPLPAAGVVHYVIKEVEGNMKKQGWKNYRTLRYQLTDARTNEVVKVSDVLHDAYTGGCKPNGMCVQVWSAGVDKQLGTSKTTELMKLINYANSIR